MHNVTPAREEALAVEATFARADAAVERLATDADVAASAAAGDGSPGIPP